MFDFDDEYMPFYVLFWIFLTVVLIIALVSWW